MAQYTIIDSWNGRQRDRKEDMNRRKLVHNKAGPFFEAYGDYTEEFNVPEIDWQNDD